jgi:UDP-2,4-diacetamido-2,4,6-trideoxy-beta-L-altropyranose hydrolase
LVIRADAGAAIGTGHVMRCLALAQTWQARGGSATLLSHCESDALRRRVEAAQISFIPLEQPYPNPSDLETTLSLLDHDASCAQNGRWLALDGYHFDLAYQQAVQAAGHRLLVIDDTAHLPRYVADVLVNQNIHAERLDYRCDPGTTMLLGTRYAMLRPEFLAWRDWKREVPRVGRRVLVTMGGSDPENATLKVIRALQRVDVDGLEAVVVVGAGNSHTEELKRGSPPFIRLVSNSRNMPELMAWADVAVSGAGSTCWELAFMGLPNLLIVLAENQTGIARGLAECLISIHLGCFSEVDEQSLAWAVSDLVRDQARRVDMSRRARELVDGLGCQRVVEELQR